MTAKDAEKIEIPKITLLHHLRTNQITAPHPKRSENRAEKLLQLIHSDVCGPINPPSLGGARYFITFTDDMSRFTTIYPLATKAECFTTFKQYKKWIENLTEKKIKILRTDNGGEYLSKAFMTYLTEHGVIHQTTVPYTPQQNGTAERLNRTLMQTVRSLLEHANLPQEFWAEALQTATYLRNRIPKTSLDNKTPFEVFHGTKPSLAHIRIFGSTAYAFNPRYTGKLNNRGTKCNS